MLNAATQTFLGDRSADLVAGYDANLLGTAGSVAFGLSGLDFYKDLSDIAYGLENWENTPGDYLNLGVNLIALIPVIGAFKNLGKPATDAASNVAKQIDDEVANLRAIGANNRSAPDFHNNISQKQPGGYLPAPTRMHSAADLDRIADIRSSLGIGKKRNIAFGEGHINGKDFGEVLGVSGQNTPGVRMPSDRVFRTGVDEFDRAFDGEVFVLENFARRLKPTDSGTLRLVSERKFCDSCSDVIAQFRERFPNIRLILVDGTP